MKGFLIGIFIVALCGLWGAQFFVASAQVFVPRDNRSGSKQGLTRKPTMTSKTQKSITISKRNTKDTAGIDGAQGVLGQDDQSVAQNVPPVVAPAPWQQPKPVAVTPYQELAQQECTKKEMRVVKSFQNYYKVKLENMNAAAHGGSANRRNVSEYNKIDAFLSTESGQNRAKRLAIKCGESLWPKE